jgi:hypothetical protein
MRPLALGALAVVAGALGLVLPALVGLATARPRSTAHPAGRSGPPRSEPPAGAIALSSAPPQTVELHLPFAGVWGVIQGFDSGETHVGYAAFALDFVPAEKLTPGSSPPLRTRLEEFPCFGKPVLAPADGRVVWARDGAVDHTPNYRGKHEAGNFVIVEHAPAELTEFRHLQRGSVVVKVGDTVRRGQVLGRCGNSGDAHTPHLHVGFLGSVDPIATRPMKLSHYERLEPPGTWRPGDGVPRVKEIVRPAP